MEKHEPLIRVADLTHAVSGEGALYGQPTARLTVGATAQTALTPTEILADLRAQSMPYDLVILGETDREPVDSLIMRAQDLGYKVACVASGAAPVDWFSNLDVLVLTPPSPSTHQTADLSSLGNSLTMGYSGERYTDVSFHITVADDTDYEFARAVSELYPSIPLWLAAASSDGSDGAVAVDRFSWLSHRVMEESWNDVQVVPQIQSA
jgi:organic radical activating enzyme